MIRLGTLAALGLAAALLAACAEQKMEQEPAAPEAEAAPMAATFDSSLLASPGAKPILLSSEAMPDGGQLEQGTLVTGSSGWAVHGESDGVAWRYGSSDAGQLRIAGVPNTEWQYIQVAESWGVQCKADGDNTPCTIRRLVPIEPGTMATGGLVLDAHVTCLRAANPNQPATISVDGAAAVSLPQPSLCLSGADSDALQAAMLGGQSVTIQAGFYPNGEQSITLPTHGLKQALAMRNWIVEQYKAGNLNAVD
jgi:invasion protein IalB